MGLLSIIITITGWSKENDDGDGGGGRSSSRKKSLFNFLNCVRKVSTEKVL